MALFSEFLLVHLLILPKCKKKKEKIKNAIRGRVIARFIRGFENFKIARTILGTKRSISISK